MNKLLFLSIFIVIGCKTDENRLSVEAGKAIVSKIEEYVSTHTNYDRFLILDSWSESFSIEKYPSGYILGPYYHGMLKQIEKYPYIYINRSRIYVNSSSLRIYDNEISVMYESHTDSSENDYYIINDAWSDYIYKAVFFYKKDGNWYINQRPDTIFVPKCVESNIHFQSE